MSSMGFSNGEFHTLYHVQASTARLSAPAVNERTTMTLDKCRLYTRRYLLYVQHVNRGTMSGIDVIGRSGYDIQVSTVKTSLINPTAVTAVCIPNRKCPPHSSADLIGVHSIRGYTPNNR